MREAALSPKFFMHAPLPMYLLDVVRAVYEHFAGRTPTLFGWRLDDEQAKFTFTLFDYPEVYLFKRTAARNDSN